MMTYSRLWRLLAPHYGEGEAQAMARMVYEVRFGLSLTDILLGKDAQLSATAQRELEEMAQRLLQNEPVQYVLSETTFCGRTFHVAPGVLIPRPETEELCRWMSSPPPSPKGEKAKILDIGTGSGCIAVTLAAMYPDAQVYGWDISAAALEIARENARRNNVHVSFRQIDVLNLPSPPPFGEDRGDTLSLIVSNPPYICNKERENMERNVLDYEPHTALFVPDDDPLRFYRAIARYGQQTLSRDGWLYFELNPLYATDVKNMLRTMQFTNIEIKNDTYGKPRMIRAKR